MGGGFLSCSTRVLAKFSGWQKTGPPFSFFSLGLSSTPITQPPLFTCQRLTLAFEINLSDLRSLATRPPHSGSCKFISAKVECGNNFVFFLLIFKKRGWVPRHSRGVNKTGRASKSCLSPVGGCESATPPLFGAGEVMHNAGVVAAAGWAARKPVMWRLQFERYRWRLKTFVAVAG